MKNYNKKLIIMFAMLLTVIGFGAIQNGTTASAITIGQQLKTPEDGWKRYDDTDTNIKFSNRFGGTKKNTLFYNGTFHSMGLVDPKETEYIKFNFYGSKLRIISWLGGGFVKDVEISFDGGKTFESSSFYRKETSLPQVVVYEKTGLEMKIHSVVINIKYQIPSIVYFDAFDIDKDGHLAPYDETLNDESLSLNKTSTDLIAGGPSEKLIVTTTPASVGVIWKSSDESVATVDSTGKVTGIKAGQATVTVSTADASNLSASCTVNVTAPSPTVASLSVTPEEVRVPAGTQQQLQVIATMSDGSTKDVTNASNGTVYTSYDNTLAPVDKDGLVTILSGARTVLDVSYGGKTARCWILANAETTR